MGYGLPPGRLDLPHRKLLRYCRPRVWSRGFFGFAGLRRVPGRASSSAVGLAIPADVVDGDGTGVALVKDQLDGGDIPEVEPAPLVPQGGERNADGHEVGLVPGIGAGGRTPVDGRVDDGEEAGV